MPPLPKGFSLGYEGPFSGISAPKTRRRRTIRPIMSYFDLESFAATPLVTEPFPYLIVPGFLKADARAAVAKDYPEIAKPGSFPTSEVNCAGHFKSMLEELEGPAVRAAFAEKFDIDLTELPTMVTVRGQARAKDGRIHTDSKTKVITVLLYMNGQWEAPGGRLRLLRSADSLDDVIAEVPPEAGTLLAFRVTQNSWHGHAPASGPRRVIQLNWVESAAVVRRERFRHGLSARVKRLFSAA